MAEVFSEILAPPPGLVSHLRAVVLSHPASLTPVWPGMLNDMWVVDDLVNDHQDGQPQGFFTFLWILVNDMGCHLWEHPHACTALPVGSLLCFDGSNYHGTRLEMRMRPVGRFGFLGWDMPHSEYPLTQFYNEVKDKYGQVSAGG